MKAREATLKSCDLILTHCCNLRCKMCYLWDRREYGNKEGQLGLEEWKRFIDALVPFSGKEPIRLHFGGGEPFLKKGILGLVKHSSRRGFTTMTTSNGFLLDKGMARKIADSGLSHITLSLDSMDERVHDYIRGTRGSHSRVLRAIDMLSRQRGRPTIGINCIISDITLDSVIPMAEWAINDDRISGIIFQAVVQPYETAPDEAWYEQERFGELWPRDGGKVGSVLEKLIALKIRARADRGIGGGDGDKISNPVSQISAFAEYFRHPREFIHNRPCPLDSSSLLVNWSGELHLCGMLQPVGNVRRLDLKDILFSGAASERREEIRSCRRGCNNKVNCFFKEAVADDGN